MKKQITLIVGMMLAIMQAMAQPVEMATTLRSEGKIYIVVAVMLIIFVGVAAYLFTLDRRVAKLEKRK
ncbi:CcmD family protein [Sphingobacterium corticibacter]|uniref:CcmD family protein n=1 Tax=Sphingobacterium corticibacter TaxID=2171749 RepID=A0A2T8HFB2_9SPHI|nr:CcmD family protein [Sphingobacterium corticibacter]PVH24128.1 CcmD family protein [Sphingobacterium corticibacter]